MDKNQILDDLISLYTGPLIVVRPFPKATEKILKCAGCSPLEMVQNIIKRHPKSSAFAFEGFNEVETLKQNDLAQSLMDSLKKNDREVGKTLENTLGDKNEKYSKWFRDWCITLAKILRIKAGERFEAPLERNGVFIFVDNEDDFNQLEEVMEKYRDFPVTIILFSQGDSTEFSQVISKYNAQYLILQTFEDFNDYSNLFEFVSKFIHSCYKNLETNVINLNSAFKGIKLSSKIIKSPEPQRNLPNLYMLMCDELGTRNETTINNVSKSTLEHEIHALSHLFYGIHLYNCKFKSQNSQEKYNTSEDSDKNVEIPNIISHFDKAISIYNKQECQWESFFTNTLSVLLGEYEEFNKLLSNNYILQPSTQNEFARSAIFIELSSNLCVKQKKKIFQLVMAGRLFSQAGLENLSKRCYLSCLDEYEDWYITHEHLYGLLAAFDDNFLVNCLNILSNAYENKYISYSSQEELHSSSDSEQSGEVDLASWKQASGNQIYYLKILMKIQSFSMKTKYLKNTPISAPFLNYPTIYYSHDLKLPLVDDKTPFLVRVPIVYLRNNGVNGTNLKLSTTYVDDLYEKLLDNSFTDPLWQKCMKFYNIKDHTKKTFLPPTDRSNGSDYMINTKLKLSLQLLNPLNIPIYCHNFKILVQELDSTNLKKNDSVQQCENKVEENEQKVSDLKWVDCEILAKDNEEGFKLGEFEKKNLILSFTTSNTGSFKIVGLCWNLFGEVVFWSPVYTVGRKQVKEVCKKISLTEFINQREVDKSLYFNVFKDMPRFIYFFRKVSDLTLLSNTVFYKKSDVETSDYDNLVRKYMEMYKDDTVNMKSSEVVENENLCLFDCFNGESSLIEISLQNVKETPIKSLVLRFKVFGAFSIPPYPVSYKLSTPNISITRSTDPYDLESVFSSKEILESVTTVKHKYDPDRLTKIINSSWSVINLPNFKVKEISLTEKMYEVCMQFNDDSINLQKKTLSVYLFFQPLMVMDGISLINGSISVSPKHGLDLVVPFKLFFRCLKGPTFNAHFNYKDVIMIKAINNSKEEIVQLKFSVNDEPVKSTNSELCPVPPKNTMNFAIPVENTLKYLSDGNNLSALDTSDRMRFSVFWATPLRFGLFNGNVEFLEYKVLVSLTVSKTELKLSDEPVIVNLVLTVHNISSELLDSMSVYPVIKHQEDSLISFIGVTKNRVDSINPGSFKSIEFTIIIPVPGIYHFSPQNFKLVGPLEQDVIYQDNINTIIVYD
uniref:Uncharacterized protein n=1 Tax=Theileria annulata TaxID=5874 RepID=A0A3B0MKB0_THEAN